MNMTFYIREADEPVIKAARRACYVNGVSLSAVVVEFLRGYVAENRGSIQKVERILKTRSGRDSNP